MNTQRSFKKMIVVLGLISISFFALYYFFYMDIKSKSRKIMRVDQELSLLNTRQEYLISTQRLLESISGDIDRINGSIVGKGADVAFIESIEKMARDKGLKIEITSLVYSNNDTASAANLAMLNVKARISGTWAGSYSFLVELESLPVKVKINNFSLVANIPQPGADGKVVGSTEWQGSFDISVLEYK